jgi:signal transduction histidine kinase
VGLFSRDGASLPDAEVVRLLSDRAEHCFLPRVVELSSHAAADLVDDALLRMRPLARERGLILRRRMKYRGPVLCHRERSLEVLASLVENAVKVTERGRVIVGVDREGACARFLVENTGPGILPSSELHRVRALVEAQSGTLSVESEIGHGSRFEFMLRIP